MKKQTTHKHLTAKEVQTLLKQMQDAAQCGDSPEWRHMCHTLGARSARIILPCGELLNPAIAGFVWAWNLQGKIGAPMALTADMRLDANGLEGCIPVHELGLMTALLVVQEIGTSRIAIYA